MTTMLDKVAVAGDITKGLDRRGVWTVAIVIIGGTANTAVKLQSADSANGNYTDFKELIASDDATATQYKGFVVDLHGAKPFIKVTGTTVATAIFGDCDHDVKNIAITTGSLPSGAELEENKAATIDVSAYTSPVAITPSSGKDGMEKVTVTLSNIPEEGATLYAFGDASAVVYLREIPSADSDSITVYVPGTTGLTETTGSYSSETGVTVSDVAYARYSTGDIEL